MLSATACSSAVSRAALGSGVHEHANESCRRKQLAKFELVVGPAVLDRNVWAFRIARVLQALVKGLHAVGEAGKRDGAYIGSVALLTTPGDRHPELSISAVGYPPTS